MRHPNIDVFSVDELLLDENNFRFKKANDQKECIANIYSFNEKYFLNLTQSIAEKQLSDILLVYKNPEGQLIVVDGNRRLSALKVLHNPSLAPDKKIQDKIQELASENEINFSNIQAQITTDSKSAMLTVYERHASSGTGKSTQFWKAFAKALFAYKESVENLKNWESVALLIHIAETNKNWSDYIYDRQNFGYETFTRIFGKALSDGQISSNIFSQNSERLRKKPKAELLKDAVDKVIRILNAMKEGEISLSREHGIYADAKGVKKFLEGFSLSPDNKKSDTPKDDDSKHDDSKANGTKHDDSKGNDTKDDDPKDDDTKDDDPKDDDSKSNNGVYKSEDIIKNLALLKSNKLSELYESLYKVSVSKHTTLSYAGAWCFFAVLARTDDCTNNGFIQYFNGRLSTYNIEKHKHTEIKNALKRIDDHGGAAKHSDVAKPENGKQLATDFMVLEDFILLVVQYINGKVKG